MGSLALNLCTFLIFFSIGFRRLYSSLSLYPKDPTLYRSKPWFFIDPKWKNLDFFALLIALPIISFSNLILFLSFSGHPSYRFGFLQYGTLIFILWVLLIVISCKKSFYLSIIHEGFVYVVFVEYFINGNGYADVSSNVLDLLGHLSLVCAFSCPYLSIRPTAFLADFCLSGGLMFKGTWVLQAGLNLYTEIFGLNGCHRLSLLPDKDEVDVRCDIDEDDLRGIALMNMFVWHCIVILTTFFGLFGLLSCKEDLRCGMGSGTLLARIESRTMLMQPLPELEIE